MIYGILLFQKNEVKKLCFRKCGKINVGAINDEIIGPMFPCIEDKCSYEEKVSDIIGIVNGEKFRVRKLKMKNEK